MQIQIFVIQESRVGAEERNKQKIALKDAHEDQLKLQKTNNVLQSQIEKHKRLLEEEKKRSEATGGQVQSLRKVRINSISIWAFESVWMYI